MHIRPNGPIRIVILAWELHGNSWIEGHNPYVPFALHSIRRDWRLVVVWTAPSPPFPLSHYPSISLQWREEEREEERPLSDRETALEWKHEWNGQRRTDEG